MSDDLESRLRDHARAFEGLMSLIPADRYYEKDNSDQWKKKKQTPEEKRAAKKAKLDPANHKSVKDVLDENERKRKRERGEDVAADSSDYEAEGREKPREGLKIAKKQKVEDNTKAAQQQKPIAAAEGATSTQGLSQGAVPSPIVDKTMDDEKAEKKREKEQRRKEKAERKQEKRQAKRADRQAKTGATSRPSEVETKGDEEEGDDVEDTIPRTNGDIEAMDVSGIVDDQDPTIDSASSPSPPPDSIFSAASAQQSATSSTSSHEEPSISTATTIAPKLDKATLQARLTAKIEALRAARKADGPDGRPARNRQELIEARRKKQETRKQNKKEQRKAAKEEELKHKAEEELARLRGSGSPLGSDIFSPSLPRSPDPHSFAFGRVSFGDGEQLGAGADGYFAPKARGPSDAKTALLAAQNRASRLAGLDATKREDIEEKERWLNAKKRAHGERVRDDVSLLKKTLKRKEKMKGRSEKEWKERVDGVVKGKEARQRKREENLAKRREEKGGKGKKKTAGKPKRPGFEGGFRSKPRK